MTYNVFSGTLNLTQSIICCAMFQLLTVIPDENSLALVYRDKETLRFVKHVNHRATESEFATEFVDFAFTYYE